MVLKKGPWTPEEDGKLVAYIQQHGHGTWRTLPAKAGLQRCGKSCRLRWNNYLRPDIKRGKFSLQEDRTILQLHAFLGSRWSTIAACLPKRTDNDIKNYWNFHLKKKLIRMGIDPITHRTANTADHCTGDGGRSKGTTSNLGHMAQWENARLEAEARLASKIGSTSSQPPARLIIGRIPARPSLRPCLDVLRAWQNSSAKPINPKGNNTMHSTYALVLTTIDDGLESPTSTLNFPVSKLPASTTVGQLNDSFPTPTISAPTVATSTSTVAASGLGFSTEIMNNNTSGLEDDDIIMAEAFTAARCNTVPTMLTNYVRDDEGRSGSIIPMKILQKGTGK